MSKGREAGGGAARRTLRVFAAPEVYAAFASEAPDSYQRLLAYASLEDPSQEPVVVLPDLSPDNALPVGTALTTQQLLLPYAIGLDPGCGYGCWVLKGALGRISPDILQDWVEQATWRPVGDEADWLIQVTFEGKTLGSTPVAPFAAVEPLAAAEQGTCPGALQRLTERVRQDLLGAFAGQVGAIALGKHFIELHSMHVLDDNSGLGSSDVLLVIHNGSLDLGLQVQKYALRLAAGTSPITPERLPVLALPADKPSGAVYMTWLAWVTRFAAANRAVLAARAAAALTPLTGPLDVSMLSDRIHSGIDGRPGPGIRHLSGAQPLEDGRLAFVGGTVAGPSFLVRSGENLPASRHLISHGGGLDIHAHAPTGVPRVASNLPETRLRALHSRFRSAEATVQQLAAAGLAVPVARTLPLAIVKF